MFDECMKWLRTRDLNYRNAMKSLLIVRLQAKLAATSSLLSVGPFMCVGPRESTAADWGG